MSGKKPLNGYLDHLRENVKNLDSAILEVRKGSEGEKPAEKRARLKLLRDLTELQNSTLTAIKTHMLGRDETGVATEPTDYYDESSNPLFEFERAFKNFLEPWTEEDLEYECEDCGKSSQEVELRTNVVVGRDDDNEERTRKFNLCSSCYAKRLKQTFPFHCEICHVANESVKTRPLPASWLGNRVYQSDSPYLCEKCFTAKYPNLPIQDDEQEEEASTRTETKDVNHPASKGDISAMLQSAALQIKVLRTFPVDQRIAKLQELLAEKPEVALGMKPAWEAYRGVLQKELDNAKASRS